VIIVVEGPTAAGKTTWCEAYAREGLVAEVRPSVDPPLDPSASARFWAEHGASRWQEAIRIEQRAGTAVCDTDPLKLHYPWSLWRIGAADQAEFEQQAAAYRESMADQRIGFADAYLVSIPDAAALDLRRSGDSNRRRRNSPLHVQLRQPLREWYAALEQVRPGSVRWAFPDEGVPAVGATMDRYELESYDALIRLVT
jgi:hypothetical protein